LDTFSSLGRIGVYTRSRPFSVSVLMRRIRVKDVKTFIGRVV
jgi:hypothetical protein